MYSIFRACKAKYFKAKSGKTKGQYQKNLSKLVFN